MPPVHMPFLQRDLNTSLPKKQDLYFLLESSDCSGRYCVSPDTGHTTVTQLLPGSFKTLLHPSHCVVGKRKPPHMRRALPGIVRNLELAYGQVFPFSFELLLQFPFVLGKYRFLGILQ